MLIYNIQDLIFKVNSSKFIVAMEVKHKLLTESRSLEATDSD